jgi:hypothetical protein
MEEEVEADIPDWLRAEVEAPLPEAPVASETSPLEDEIPDWLMTPIPYFGPSSRVAPAPEPPAPPQQPPVAEEIAPEPEEVPLAAPAPIPTESRPSVSEAITESARPMIETPAPRPAEPVVPPIPEPAEEVPVMALPPEPRRVEAVPPVLPTPAPPERPTVRVPAGRSRYDPSQQLEAARKALATGDYSKAASSYGSLIKRNVDIGAITDELRLALDRNPQAAVLWQTLGDAYMKGDRLHDAIEAYRRGMEAA